MKNEFTKLFVSELVKVAEEAYRVSVEMKNVVHTIPSKHLELAKYKEMLDEKFYQMNKSLEDVERGGVEFREKLNAGIKTKWSGSYTDWQGFGSGVPVGGWPESYNV